MQFCQVSVFPAVNEISILNCPYQIEDISPGMFVDENNDDELGRTVLLRRPLSSFLSIIL